MSLAEEIFHPSILHPVSLAHKLAGFGSALSLAFFDKAEN